MFKFFGVLVALAMVCCGAIALYTVFAPTIEALLAAAAAF